MLQFTNYPISFASVTVPYSISKCCFEFVCSRHNPVWSKWWISNPTDLQSPLWTFCVVALLFTISSQLHTAWIGNTPFFGCLSTCYSGTPLILSVLSLWLTCMDLGALPIWHNYCPEAELMSQSQHCSWACYQLHLPCRCEGTVSVRALSLPMEARP